MSVYLDSSALVKRYVAEPGSELVGAVMGDDPSWIAGRHALVEVWLALARLLPSDRIGEARDAFARDWRRMTVVELDDQVCRIAGRMGDNLGCGPSMRCTSPALTGWGSVPSRS